MEPIKSESRMLSDREREVLDYLRQFAPTGLGQSFFRPSKEKIGYEVGGFSRQWADEIVKSLVRKGVLLEGPEPREITICDSEPGPDDVLPMRREP